ncbi:E3 ubiquitin-protein ligase ATL6-like [Hordeum vulgare subsp. vulgare]|uniref:RING-type E3 ubiquitin transferase n=1 Tax=Hordeum vulgare subsp. vulgare TaxID=112509 RepID=A0A8I6XU67_HORVV|nr:E3 ubiquitin-protein ligase ATL6-like [Hordeum vulgare subsp. vulgare]
MAASRERSLPAVLLVLAAIASRAAAQTPGGPGPSNSMSFSDVMTISFFMAIFFPVFVVLLAFACLRMFRPHDEPPASESSSSSARSRSRHKEGLDAAEIAALPLVSYRDVRQHRIGASRVDPLECAVCLLEFDDDDSLRLLPACPHAFHPECIGLWLEKHVTCPLCRASVLDAPLPDPEEPTQPPSPEGTPAAPESPPLRQTDHDTVVLIEDPGCNGEEDDGTRDLARTRALPQRSNSTGHERGGGTEHFALRLPEHVRVEILMSHRLRHVTSAVASVRVREGSAHDPAAGGGSVRAAVARLLSLFAPGDGWRGGDDEEKSGGSSRRRRDESARGAGEDKRND